MRIRFMGLICHIHRAEAGGTEIAVLVRAPAHLPRLRVERRHLFGLPANANGTICESLVHRTISFDPLGAGVADRAGLVGVPRLSDLGGTGGALDPKVVAKDATDPTDSLESFVVLPTGTYGVEDRFFFTGTIAGSAPQCIARTVTYDVPVAVAKVTILGLPPGHTVELKPTAEITITNLEPRSGAGLPHFSEYGNIFTPSRAIASPGSKGMPPCPGGTKDYRYPRCPDEDFQNIGVECSNSTFP